MHLRALQSGHNTARIPDYVIKDGVEYGSLSTAVEVMPDGRTAITSSIHGDLRLWDVNRGTELRSIDAHDDLVSDIAISTEAAIALSGSWDGTVRFWSLPMWEQTRVLSCEGAEVTSVAISLDGTRALAGSKDGAIIVWSLPDFERIKILQGHSSLVEALEVTPDRKHFLSSSHDGVKVWDLEFLTEVSQFTTVVWEPHPLSIVSACLTHHDLLVTGQENGWLRTWDLSGEPVAHVRGSASRVTAVTSSPIEDLIIVCTDDGLITLRDHETLAIRATFLDEGNWPMAVHVIPGCSFMVTASYDGILKLWDIHNHREIAVLGDHEDTVRALASTPDGSLLLSGSDDGILKVWNLESREIVRTLRAHEAAIHSIATDSHGELAVSASMDGIVRVWRLGPFDDDGQFGDGKVGFSAVAVLPGDKHLIAGSVDGDLMRWRLGDRKKLRTFLEPSGAIKLLSLTEDRRHLISVADWGDYVTLWNCEPWKALTWIELMEDILRPISVYSICVVQRKNRIVTGSEGGVIQIWDGQSFSALDSLQYGRKYINSVDRIDVSDDGARAVSLEDGMIRTWDLERMELAGIWYVSGKKLTGCAIAPAGDIVVATDPAGDLASVLF